MLLRSCELHAAYFSTGGGAALPRPGVTAAGLHIAAARCEQATRRMCQRRWHHPGNADKRRRAIVSHVMSSECTYRPGQEHMNDWMMKRQPDAPDAVEAPVRVNEIV